MSRSISKPSLKPQAPRDQHKQLEGKAKTYPMDQGLQKLDTVEHLYVAINVKDARMQQLESEATKLRSQVITSSSNAKINQAFDQIVRRTNDATTKQIELLKQENARLNQQLLQAKREKAAAITQIKLPSLTESYSKAFQAKIRDIGEVQKLKQHNQALQSQNVELRRQIEEVNSKFSRLTNQFKEQFAKLRERREAEDGNRATVNSEIARLKKKQETLDQENKRLQKKVQSQATTNQAVFAFLKETLGLVGSVEPTNKLSESIKTFRYEEIGDENKKKKIKDAILQNNRNLNELKENYRKAKEQISKNQKSLSQNQKTLSAKSNQISILSKKNSDLESIKATLTNQRNQLSKLKTDNEITIGEQRDNISQMKKTISTLESEKTQNIKTIGQRQKTIKLNEQELEKRAADIRKLTQQNTNLKSRIQTLSKEVASLSSKIQVLQKDISEKAKRISFLQALQIDLRRQIDKLNKEIAQLKARIQRLQAEIANKQRQISTYQAIISKHEQDLKTQKKQRQQADSRVVDSQRIIDKINKQLIAQASQYLIGQTLPIKSTTPDRINQLSAQAQSLLSSWKASFNFVKFFNNSEIITKDSLSFVLNSLEDFMGCTPFESRLVYKYDPLNNVNFHNYFDKIENLISFIKLSNGTIIGGFTVYPIDAERIQRPGKGFLFNLTHKKVYNIRSQPKLPVVSYDNYYYIFGNAEIRLKSQEKKVFSNFGIANSTFDNGPDLRTKFLNVSEMTNNELEIETYEFYRVNFKM